MEKVVRPLFKLTIAGKDVTSDIANMVLSISYTDKAEGESDEVDITLEDSDGLWRGSWYPNKGDKMQLWIGYTDLQVNCGEFVIDEIEMSGPPDTMSISGLAAAITKAVRTKNSTAHEQKNLKQIVQEIAGKNGLSVEGEIEAIKIERVTQHRETDLAFLKRLGEEYGYLFSVRGDKLVFTNIFKLEDGKVVRQVDRTDLIRHSLRDKGVKTFKQSQVKYHNPKTAKVVEAKVDSKENADKYAYSQITAVDTKEIRVKAENKQQANLKAKALLHKDNSCQQEGSITIIGDPLMLAGNNFELTGLGTLSGKYHIMKSRHSISRGGGYETEVEIKRVGFVSIEKQKPKPRKPAQRNYTVKVIQ